MNENASQPQSEQSPVLPTHPSSMNPITSAASLVPESDAPLAPAPPPAVIKIVFYCKDCDRLVSGIKVGNKYVYKCPLCGTKNVAFGTEKSIRSFYRVKDLPPPAAPANRAPMSQPR